MHRVLFVRFLCSFQTPCTPLSFKRDLNQLLASQERELESRRSSLMTMEVLVLELNAERAAKNEEIQRLKVNISLRVGYLPPALEPDGLIVTSLPPQMQLTEKDVDRMEIQTLLEEVCTKESQDADDQHNLRTPRRSNEWVCSFSPSLWSVSSISGSSELNNVTSTFSEEPTDNTKQSLLQTLQEERNEKVWVQRVL